MQYAWVDNGTAFKMYRNGVAMSAKDGYKYGTLAGQRLYYVGSYPSFGTNGFEGQIDDLAVWTRELSAAEIKAIHTNGKAGFPLRWK